MLFIRLFSLYKRNSLINPLEDFTTEIFVGILKSNPHLLDDFSNNFLNLKGESFQISSQEKCHLENDTDCIVDIVIKNENNICFIENKVHSKEGLKQLERYTKVLDTFIHEGINTKLCYCTKFPEKKDVKKHNFKQFKWYHISRFLAPHKEEQIINQFIEFLKHYDMTQDLIITAKEIMALEYYPRVLNIIHTYTERLKPNFESKFGKAVDLRRRGSEISEYNRYSLRVEKIIDDKHFSEILYGFQFKGFCIIQIYINNGVENYNEIVSEIKKKNIANLTIEESNHGIRIYSRQSLGNFIHVDDSEIEIEKWFKDKFETYKELISSTNQKIQWNINGIKK
jgi:hypothetical protein